MVHVTKGAHSFFTGVAIAGALLALYHIDAARSEIEGAERTYVAGTRTDTATWKVFARGDGQTFAALAEDPSLSHPERFQPQVIALSKPGAEAAYRAQRPLLGWATAVLSLGQEPLIPFALLALTVLSGGLATWAATTVSPRGLFVVGLPGFVAAIMNVGPEAAAMAATVGGLALWPGRRTRAAGLFTLAVLLRESLLVVPAAVAAYEVLRNRRWVWSLAWGPALLAAWLTVVWWRVDAWPWDAGYGRLTLPFTGLSTGMSAIDVTLGSFLVLLLVAGAVAARGPEQWVILGHLVLLAVLGTDVWDGWEDLHRVMLPGAAVAALALLPEGRRRPVGEPAPT